MSPGKIKPQNLLALSGCLHSSTGIFFQGHMLDNILSKCKDARMLRACTASFDSVSPNSSTWHCTTHSSLASHWDKVGYLSWSQSTYSKLTNIPAAFPVEMGGDPACSELCHLTVTGITTWGKLLSFLSVIEGEDVNLPSLCVFLYLVCFYWYSQLHSYRQLSVFLVRIGTDFWLMLCYNFQAKYQKVCSLISSLTVFRTLIGCVQKCALQTADMASCLELSTAFDILPGSDILFANMRSYQNSRSHGTMILLNVFLPFTLLHLHDKVFWKYQHEMLE